MYIRSLSSTEQVRIEAGLRSSNAFSLRRSQILLKIPWLNSIEPKWVYGKRVIVEPARLLTTQEVRQRVCDYFNCELLEPFTQEVS